MDAFFSQFSFLVVVAVAYLLFRDYQAHSPRSVVRARRFVAVDEYGRERVALGLMKDDAAGLRIFQVSQADFTHDVPFLRAQFVLGDDGGLVLSMGDPGTRGPHWHFHDYCEAPYGQCRIELSIDKSGDAQALLCTSDERVVWSKDAPAQRQGRFIPER
jgi:hypothetical protein